MRERIVKVTAEEFAKVQNDLRLARIPDPFGGEMLDTEKAKEILRRIGVQSEDNVTYRFVVE